MGEGSVAPELREQREQAECVPDGHDATESRRNALSGGGVGWWAEAADGGVDEGCHGKLIPDHEAGDEDGEEIKQRYGQGWLRQSDFADRTERATAEFPDRGALPLCV